MFTPYCSKGGHFCNPNTPSDMEVETVAAKEWNSVMRQLKTMAYKSRHPSAVTVRKDKPYLSLRVKLNVLWSAFGV